MLKSALSALPVAFGFILLAVLSGCASDGGTSSGGSGASDPEMITAPPVGRREGEPFPEDPTARTTRLLRIEQACDQWHEAVVRQEYGRAESLALLLRDYTNENFEQIVSDLEFGSPRYKKVMAAALGFSKRQDAVPPLVKSLEDPYQEVVLHSLLSLYHLSETPTDTSSRDTPIVIDPEVIVPRLTHPSADVRSNAALALSRLVKPGTSKSVVLALIAVCSDQDDAARLHAIAALGATKDREALPHLLKALDDPVQLVRVRAALALARLGDPSAAPYLVEVLARQEEKDVKTAAARALGSLLNVRDNLTIDPAFWREQMKKG